MTVDVGVGGRPRQFRVRRGQGPEAGIRQHGRDDPKRLQGLGFGGFRKRKRRGTRQKKCPEAQC